MNNRTYFERIAQEVENEDFSTLLKELGYEGKTLEEAINLLAESKDGFEKVRAFEEKYYDDILDLKDEIAANNKECNDKLEELGKEEAEVNNSRLENVRTYNRINHQLSGIKNNKVDPEGLRMELKSVLEELAEIDRKEKLLDGNLSNRAIKRREELLKRKEELENTQEVKKDEKKVIYKHYNEDVAKLNEIKEQRKSIIEETERKNNAVDDNIKVVEIETKKYQHLQFEVLSRMVSKKTEIDAEFEDVEKRFNEAIKSGETSYIATLGQEYIEKKNKKIDYDNSIKKIADLLGTTMEELGLAEEVEETKEEVVENPKVVLPVMDEEEKIQQLRDKLSPANKEEKEETEELTEDPKIEVESTEESNEVETPVEEIEESIENPEVEEIPTVKNVFEIGEESESIEENNEVETPTEEGTEELTEDPEIEAEPIEESNEVETPVEEGTEELTEDPEIEVEPVVVEPTEDVVEPELKVEYPDEKPAEESKPEEKKEKRKKTPWYERFLDKNDEEDEDDLDLENQKSLIEEIKEKREERRQIKSVEQAPESLIKKGFEKLRDMIARFALNDEGYEVWQEEQKTKTK